MTDQHQNPAGHNLPASPPAADLFHPNGAAAAKLNAAPAGKKPTTSQVATAAGGLLAAAPSLQISSRLRRLLGPSVFRDPTAQIEAEQILLNLLQEFSVKTAVQALLANNASRIFVQLRQYQSTLETAVRMKRPEAARGVIDYRFQAFYPPPPGVPETPGLTTTAYAQFMLTAGTRSHRNDGRPGDRPGHRAARHRRPS